MNSLLRSRVPIKCIQIRILFRIKIVHACSVVSDFCDPLDCSPPGSSVRGIFQARILEWVAVSYSRRSSWPRDLTHISRISCLEQILYTVPPGKPLGWKEVLFITLGKEDKTMLILQGQNSGKLLVISKVLANLGRLMQKLCVKDLLPYLVWSLSSCISSLILNCLLIFISLKSFKDTLSKLSRITSNVILCF